LAASRLIDILRNGVIVALAFIALAVARPVVARDWDNAACMKCHGDIETTTKPENQRRAEVAASRVPDYSCRGQDFFQKSFAGDME
jgi:hypothetical protein